MLKRLWFLLRCRNTFGCVQGGRQGNRSSLQAGPDDTPPEPAADEDKPASQPLPHPDYQPMRVTPVLQLPVHYWFHVFLYSSDCDRLLAPFVKSLGEDFPTDRRLLSIMNRCQVRVSMGQLELYKSLPRYVIALNGVNWESIVRAMVELEAAFPELLRFASHPLLMDTPTQRFSTSHWRQTALQTRVTG